MEQAKHLPGPWTASDGRTLEGRSGTYKQITDGPVSGMGANIIAWVCVAHPLNHDLQQSGEANARLIKAAPELLEACEEALEELYRVSPSFAAPKLRAAIAKATGVRND